MNTKDIFEKLQKRIGFTNEVIKGLSQFFRDFEKSSQGQNFRVDAPDHRDAIVTTNAHGGLDILSRTPVEGENHNTGITVSAQGRVEITAMIGREFSHQSMVEFDTETDDPVDVVAKTVAAIMASPQLALADKLDLYVQAPIEPIHNCLNFDNCS